MLCLTNGQKIKVTDKIRIMFEVEDLLYASLATVSRCGMVYMEPEQLGWRNLVKKFIQYELPSEYPDALKEIFLVIFE
jgi:dynein heavy chain